MRKLFAATAAIVALSATIADAGTKLFAFGDSLVDSGNAQILTLASGGTWDSTVYPNGQFTNGDTWTTQLGLSPSLSGGTNFAYGGARAIRNEDPIPDLLEQIESFSRSGISGSGAAATIWVGGNDFLALPSEASNKQVKRTIRKVVRSISKGVKTLAKSGVADVLVLGLPDFGLLPSNAGNPEASARASYLTSFYNSKLERVLAKLNRRFDASVRYFDTNSVFQQVVASVPQPLVSVPCILQPVQCAQNPTDYVFYDPIHPSEWVHTILAQAVAQDLGISAPGNAGGTVIAAVPLPASGLLLLFGLGGVALLSLRRRSPA